MFNQRARPGTSTSGLPQAGLRVHRVKSGMSVYRRYLKEILKIVKTYFFVDFKKACKNPLKIPREHFGKAAAPARGLHRFRVFPLLRFGARKIHSSLRARQRGRLFNAAYTVAAFISLQRNSAHIQWLRVRARTNRPCCASADSTRFVAARFTSRTSDRRSTCPGGTRGDQPENHQSKRVDEPKASADRNARR